MSKKIIELLKRYEQTKNKLMYYTLNFYDAMGSDLDGYWEEIDSLDASDIADLEKKIKNFEALTKCYAKIDFKYC